MNGYNFCSARDHIYLRYLLLYEKVYRDRIADFN